MHVRLSDPALADEFIGFLRSANWTAHLGEVEGHADGIAIEVEVPDGQGEQKARRELALYLQGWEAVYSGSRAELLD